MNVNDFPNKLKKDTAIGNFFVSLLRYSRPIPKNMQRRKSESIRIVIVKACEGLSGLTQEQKIKEFVFRYQDTFGCEDGVKCNANVARHKIDTGDARLI